MINSRAIATIGILAALLAGCGGGGGTSPTIIYVQVSPTPTPTLPALNYLPAAQSSPGNQYAFESPTMFNGAQDYGFSAGPLEPQKNALQASLSACATAASVYPIFYTPGFFTLHGDDTQTASIPDYIVSRSVATNDVVVYAMFPTTGGTACIQPMILAKAGMRSGDTWTMKNSLTGVTHTAFVSTDHLSSVFSVGTSGGPHSGAMNTYNNTSTVQYDGGSSSATWAPNIGAIELKYIDQSTKYPMDFLLYSYTITNDSK